MCFIHKYEIIASQQLRTKHTGLLNVQRIVSICKKCGKIKYESMDISISQSFIKRKDLDWQPKLNLLDYKRDIKLKKLGIK